ncbi:hypothetical protein KRM28CT15_42880 [Krasilnikovia sp. M28-CT-15]
MSSVINHITVDCVGDPHVDVKPTDRTRDEEVTRLLNASARLVSDQRRSDGTGWAVLADPEGNEFCVERSDDERGSD